MSIYQPSNDAIASLMAYGQKMAQNDAKWKREATAVRKAEIAKLTEWNKATPERQRSRKAPSAYENPQMAVDAARRGMECVKAGGDLGALAAELGMVRSTLVYYMQTREGYKPGKWHEPKFIFTPAMKREAVKLRREKKTFEQIGQHFGCSANTLRKLVEFPGEPVRTRVKQ